ncbi:MAG: polysulfide reductase NrfD [Spirochaetota bacterium]|nr:polysulfide reductase NrfD [Spirochaetota bacterium]
MHDESKREPLVHSVSSLGQITEEVSKPLNERPNKVWYIYFGISLALLLFGAISLYFTLFEGIGTWGNNKSVGWAFAITNFVFWVGIGHAGTFISAILLLFRQKWRNSINRSAETMTIFAVICAAIFPVIHLGRPWLAAWFLPYPNSRNLWVNFNSPLLWDVFAISTYFTVSLVFWYIGMVPDFATLRDQTKNKIKKKIYSLISINWNGSAQSWSRHEIVSLVLAGLAAPLVLSVHSIVSTDFATSVIPGWHTTIFPPYFVAGAIFSGFAMVLTLMIIIRKVFNFDKYITLYHFEQMTKVIILTGSLVGLAYSTEFFVAWYSGNGFELFAFVNRATGPFWWAYWIMVTCNVVSPQLFWFKKIRTSIPAILILSILINVGMWFERFVIVVTSLHRDFLPSSWTDFSATWVDAGLFIGSFGLFFTLFLLFIRVGPYVSIAEVKDLAAKKLMRRSEDHG